MTRLGAFNPRTLNAFVTNESPNASSGVMIQGSSTKSASSTLRRRAHLLFSPTTNEYRSLNRISPFKSSLRRPCTGSFANRAKNRSIFVRGVPEIPLSACTPAQHEILRADGFLKSAPGPEQEILLR